MKDQDRALEISILRSRAGQKGGKKGGKKGGTIAAANMTPEERTARAKKAAAASARARQAKRN